MSTWHGVMANEEEFMRWKISTKTVDGYKTDTKCAHSVHGRPTQSWGAVSSSSWLNTPLPRAKTREFYIITRHEVDTDLIFPCMCRRYLTRVWSWAHSCETSPARTRGDKRRVPKAASRVLFCQRPNLRHLARSRGQAKCSYIIGWHVRNHDEINILTCER